MSLRILFWLTAALYALTWAYRLAYWVAPWPLVGAGAARLHWALMIGGALMPYILAAGVILLLIVLWLRARRWIMLGAIALMLEGGVSLSRTIVPYSNQPLLDAATLSLATFNMQANTDALADFAAMAQDMDVIHLSEVPNDVDMGVFDRLFPNHAATQGFYWPQPQRIGRRGSMVILTRGAATVQLNIGRDGDARPIFDVRVRRQGRDIRILATHPLAPFSPAMMRIRNGTLARLRALASVERDIPTILMGDLNTTPFEVDGWRLPGRLVGNPFRISWSGMGNLLHLRIDHIRVRGGDLRAVRQQIGPYLGADHLPLFAQFEF